MDEYMARGPPSPAPVPCPTPVPEAVLSTQTRNPMNVFLDNYRENVEAIHGAYQNPEGEMVIKARDRAGLTLTDNQKIFFAALAEMDPEGTIISRLRGRWLTMSDSRNKTYYQRLSEIVESGPAGAFRAAYFLSMGIESGAEIGNTIEQSRRFIENGRAKYGDYFDDPLFGISELYVILANRKLGEQATTSRYFMSNIQDVTEGKWYFLGIDSLVRVIGDTLGVYKQRAGTAGTQYQMGIDKLESLAGDLAASQRDMATAAMNKDSEGFAQASMRFTSNYLQVHQLSTYLSDEYPYVAAGGAFGAISTAATPALLFLGVKAAKAGVSIVSTGLREVAVRTGAKAAGTRIAGELAETAPTWMVRATTAAGKRIAAEFTMGSIGFNAGFGVFSDSVWGERKIAHALVNWMNDEGEFSDVAGQLTREWAVMTGWNIALAPLFAGLGRVVRAGWNGLSGFRKAAVELGEELSEPMRSALMKLGEGVGQDVQVAVSQLRNLYLETCAQNLSSGTRRLLEQHGVGLYYESGAAFEKALQELATNPNVNKWVVQSTLSKYTQHLNLETSEAIAAFLKSEWRLMQKEMTETFAIKPLETTIGAMDRLFANMEKTPLAPVARFWAERTNSQKVLAIFGIIYAGTAPVSGVVASRMGEKANEELRFEIAKQILMRQDVDRTYLGEQGYFYIRDGKTYIREEKMKGLIAYQDPARIYGELSDQAGGDIYVYICQLIKRAEKEGASNNYVVDRALAAMSQEEINDLFKKASEYGDKKLN